MQSPRPWGLPMALGFPLLYISRRLWGRRKGRGVFPGSAKSKGTLSPEQTQVPSLAPSHQCGQCRLPSVSVDGTALGFGRFD